MPEMPPELAYLWRFYFRLRRRIGRGFDSPNPIGWQDVDAFVRRTGFRLAPWEVECLEAIDDAYLQPTPKPSTALSDSASTNDPKAVKSLLRSIGKRRSTKKGG